VAIPDPGRTLPDVYEPQRTSWGILHLLDAIRAFIS